MEQVNNYSEFEVSEMIEQLIRQCHNTAKEKGWWDQQPERSFPEQIALMHSELSEALEEYRNGRNYDELYYSHSDDPNAPKKPEGVAAEFADVLIRIFDTCGRYNIPLDQALLQKMAYNKTRPYRHGGKKS